MLIYKPDGTAVEIATGGGAGDESIAKEKLTGKVLLAIGDSYTVGMTTQLAALAAKFGMIIDNVGYAGASICWRSTYPEKRLYNITDTAVSAYTSGKTINGTTYHASDVGIVTFMGGGNDDPAVENWIGTGPHETDKTKIYGSLNHIFATLQSTFTGAKVICITQPSFYNLTVSSVTTDARAQELGFENLAELQVMDDVQFSNYGQGAKEEAVRTMAWRYGCEFVDMFHDFPTVNNPSNRSTYWQNDKLHLTTAGYNLVAKGIERKIVEVWGQ